MDALALMWMPLSEGNCAKGSLDLTTSLPRARRDRTKRRWIRMPFLGDISIQLKKMLQHYGFQPAFYPLCTIRTLFSNLKDPVPLGEQSGVYSLPCDNCNAVYIGETGRSFAIRLHKHIDQRPYSSRHLQQEKHAFKKGSETFASR